jgi:hypothetical protein
MLTRAILEQVVPVHYERWWCGAHQTKRTSSSSPASNATNSKFISPNVDAKIQINWPMAPARPWAS